MISESASMNTITWTGVVTNFFPMCGFLIFAVSIRNLNLEKLLVLSFLFAGGNASFIIANCLNYVFYRRDTLGKTLQNNLAQLFLNLTILCFGVASFLFSINYWNLSFKLKHTISGRQMDHIVSKIILAVYYTGIAINIATPALAFSFALAGWSHAADIIYIIVPFNALISFIFLGDGLRRIKTVMKGQVSLVINVKAMLLVVLS
jgi:multisubunit Na+/H+ antiporter MnhC subunit